MGKFYCTAVLRGKPIALTPALSHPMGEGESSSVFLERRVSEFIERSSEKQKGCECCSLSRLTREGQGEGDHTSTAKPGLGWMILIFGWRVRIFSSNH
jgi:hypothetical protein